MEVDGVVMRPDTRQIVQKAIEGHPVEVLSEMDYLNLYHVFGRQLKRVPGLRSYRMVRCQIDHSRWRVVIRPERIEGPEYEPEGDYNPKRRRYRRYAHRLAAGEALVLESRAEAVKARRAWQLYFPAPQRQGLSSRVRKVGTGPRHKVWLVPKDGGK